MFAVNGDQFGPGLADRIHHQLATGDQNFFVCQTDALGGANGFIRGFEARDANDGRNDDIDLGCCGDLHPSLRPKGEFGPPGHRQTTPGQLAGKLVATFSGGNSHCSRVEFQNLLEQEVDITARGQPIHLEAVAILADDVEGIGAD